MTKTRLDQLLMQRGLAPSRQRARALIMAGLVRVDGVRADKPGRSFPEGATIAVQEVSRAFVSRGGEKLQAALSHFGVEVAGNTWLDIGASTGGFTDCLLQHGARRVIAVDVGYGQLDWKLRQDPRVRVLEKTNARLLTPEALGETVDGAVIDVSFISLRLVFPAVVRLLRPGAVVVPLIKPQFEVGKGLVGKGGVVRDAALHRQVTGELSDFFRSLGWAVRGPLASPILGPKGNREFFLLLRRGADPDAEAERNYGS